MYSEKLMYDDMIIDNGQKRRRDLRDVGAYRSGETLNANDFDIAFRTPADLLDNQTGKARRKYFLPNDFEVVPDADKVSEEIHKSFGIEYQKPKNKNEELVGFYSRDRDKIYVEDNVSEDPQTLAHEGFHQKHRRMEKAAIEHRVLSEPRAEHFKHFDSAQVKRDVNQSLHEFDVTTSRINKFNKSFDKEPYYERLAEYVALAPQEIANPKTRTGKFLNRMYFE